MSAADLLREVRTRPLGDGRYRAAAGPAWSYALPSGGVLMSIALDAMADALGDAAYRPISATAIFASAIREGDLDLVVRVLRRGKAAVQLVAAVKSPGDEPGLEVSATFARPLPGPRFTSLVMPEVAPPDVAVDLSASHDRWAFFRQVEVRHGLGPGRFDQPFAPGPPRHARWFRYKVAPRGAAGALERVAFPPLLDTMPGAIMAHLGPDHRLYAPSLDLTVHFVADTDDEWLLCDSFARAVFDGYATCDAHLWSRGGTLVAYATQTMILKFVDKKPT